MPETCNNITYSTTCQDDQLSFAASNSSSSTPAIIELDLPAGAQILDPDGQVVYTVPGDPRKSRVRIPPSAE